MRQQPGIATNRNGLVTLLSLSPLEDDHASLQGIVGHTSWMMYRADSLPAARSILRQHDISVVLCERDLMPGTWLELLGHINDLPHPPSLIVTSRLADERLWAEALNMGAWDVLAKPFDRNEVLRSVKSGWQHWHNQIQIPSVVTKVMRAAS